jgi:lactam utilization protein B
MSSNINSNNVALGFHAPSVITMGGCVDPHKQMTSVFQQVVE